MRIIEILSEDKKDWSTITGYDIDRMKNQFSDQKSARRFFRGKFIVEVKKVLGLLVAWENMAKKYNYVNIRAEAAKMFAAQVISAAERMPTNEEVTSKLPDANIKLIKQKIEEAALVFGSLGHDFKDIGEIPLGQASIKLHDLLRAAAAEVELPPVAKTKDVKKTKRVA